jgi:arabinofuranan 3-O-arabinosyltransferase
VRETRSHARPPGWRVPPRTPPEYATADGRKPALTRLARPARPEGSVAPPAARDRAEAAERNRLDPRIPLALGLLSFALALAQRPGWATSDTKIDLHVSPLRFLGEVASAWTPDGTLGQVWSGQYGGYLWPMGPFFALGHELGVSSWLVERLWLGLLLTLMAWGTVRLLDALLEEPRGVAHLAAGSIVLLNPYVVVFSNRTTFFLLGYAALPWLLLAMHRGLSQPRRWWWPAAVALIVTSMGGGVNAAVTAFMLVGALLLLLYEQLVLGVPWSAVRSFCARALPLMLLASLWWILPVLVAARYGLDFLPFTEHPGAIWSTPSLPESLRLMGYWISYLGVGYGSSLRPYFGDSGLLLFNPLVVTATLVTPALALVGFAWTRRCRYGPFFLGLALVGLLIMSAGWPEGAPLRHGLNFSYNHISSLRFLRTTYKAGPLLGLALACLGGVAAGRLWRALAAFRPARAGLALAGAGLLALSAWPLVSGRAIDKQVSWKRIPPAWTQVARDLDGNLPRSSRAVVLPGQAFAFYRWGGTVDPILPALTKRPVSVRNVPPYADAHAVDLFWTIDSLVQQRRLVPGELRPLLGLIGARSVVTATDDDSARSGAMAPADAARALAPQLGRPARHYGPTSLFPPAAGELGAPLRLPQVRRYDLPASRPIVRVEPAGGETLVDGSADALAQLAAFGPLPGGALRYAADQSPDRLRATAAGGNVVISDSNRRQVWVASRIRQDRGEVMTAGDPLSADAALLNPFAARGSDAQTVAVYHGARYVRAASNPGFSQFPEHRPFAAFDGSPGTYWLADPAVPGKKLWIEIGFDAPRAVDHIEVLPHQDPRAAVSELDVAGHRYALHSGWNRLELRLPPVRSLRVSVPRSDSIRRLGDYAGGLDEIRVPGVHVTEALRLPVVAEHALTGRDLSGTGLTYLFSRTTGDQPFERGSVPLPVLTGRRYDKAESEPYYVRGAGDAETGLDRIFSPPAARRWRADGWVTVAPAAPDSAIDRLAGYRGSTRFDSSSRFEGRPGYRASGAFDGSGSRAWVGGWAPNGIAWISWSTLRPVTLDRLRIAPPGLPVRRPSLIRLRWPGGATAPLPVGPGGDVPLGRAVRARSFRLEILRAAPAPGASRGVLAVGIGELSGSGVPRLRAPRSGGRLTASCGALAAAVGGSRLKLRPVGSLAALDAGEPLRAQPCGTPARLPAGAAELRVRAGLFEPYLIRLSSPVAHAAPAPGGRVLDTGSEGLGSHDHVRVSLTRPALLVLGESYNRGWRASCDGHSLGTPFVVDGYANGWEGRPGCVHVSFHFGPNRALDVGYGVSALACLLMLALLALRRPGPALPAGGDLPDDAVRRGLGLRRALLAGAVAAGVVGFVFALRAGALAGPAVALLLWRGVGTRKLTLAAGGLLVLVVPLVYLIWPDTDRGGYNTDFALDHRGAHWVAVAAFVLLTLALGRTLAVSRASGPSRARARTASNEPEAGA